MQVQSPRDKPGYMGLLFPLLCSLISEYTDHPDIESHMDKLAVQGFQKHHKRRKPWPVGEIQQSPLYNTLYDDLEDFLLDLRAPGNGVNVAYLVSWFAALNKEPYEKLGGVETTYDHKD